MLFLLRRISSTVFVLACGTAMLFECPRGLRAESPSTPPPPAVREGDSEEDLLARLQRERDPVRKAKVEIRLGRVKLLQAIEAYDRGDLDQCRELLRLYLERMKSCWGTLKISGREAVRHPQGFKELDIALREDERTIEDLKRRVPYLERPPIEKTAQEVEQLHSEVFRALFPLVQPAAPGGPTRPRGRPNPSGGGFEG